MATETTLVFRHSGALRGLATFFTFGIPLAVTGLVIARPPEDPGEVLAVVAIYGLFLCLSVPLFWDTTRYYLGVSSSGVDCGSPWKARRLLAWQDIESISYGTVTQWFIIRAKDGWRFRVPTLVPGLSDFLERCEEHLPRAALSGARQGYEVVGRDFPA